MGGGIAQAYTTMGFCTFMKTVEVTRHKSAGNASTWAVASDIFKKEGIAGINKGKQFRVVLHTSPLRCPITCISPSNLQFKSYRRQCCRSTSMH